ncbi:MAG: hypothetical protein DMG80_12140 [Acidobacteria bacterium]|nr:MAG: hypothetical protein DMG80_12140 [Acidobacteriota bacterium]
MSKDAAIFPETTGEDLAYSRPISILLKRRRALAVATSSKGDHGHFPLTSNIPLSILGILAIDIVQPTPYSCDTSASWPIENLCLFSLGSLFAASL